jgi:hypothetical protein
MTMNDTSPMTMMVLTLPAPSVVETTTTTTTTTTITEMLTSSMQIIIMGGPGPGSTTAASLGGGDGSNSSSTSAASGSGSGDSSSTVGIVVGLVGAAFLVLAVAAYVYFRRREGQSNDSENPYADPPLARPGDDMLSAVHSGRHEPALNANVSSLPSIGALDGATVKAHGTTKKRKTQVCMYDMIPEPQTQATAPSSPGRTAPQQNWTPDIQSQVSRDAGSPLSYDPMGARPASQPILSPREAAITANRELARQERSAPNLMYQPISSTPSELKYVDLAAETPLRYVPLGPEVSAEAPLRYVPLGPEASAAHHQLPSHQPRHHQHVPSPAASDAMYTEVPHEPHIKPLVYEELAPEEQHLQQQYQQNMLLQGGDFYREVPSTGMVPNLNVGANPNLPGGWSTVKSRR